MKKILSIALVVVLLAGIAVSGTMAYLQDTASDVNVMTLGNVYIEQHEYERKVDVDGNYVTDDDYGYKLKAFTQGKPLYPVTELNTDGTPNNFGAGDYGTTRVKMSQVGSHGSMDVFASKNAQDKFVTVENTGRTDAYVRTLVAFELGEIDAADFDKIIRFSSRYTEDDADLGNPWVRKKIGVIVIDGNSYVLFEFIYQGDNLSDSSLRHENGVLPAGDTTYPSLCQVYMTAAATNEHVEKIDGNGNDTYDILVFSQAVQTEGFADAETALDAAFGDITIDNHPWIDESGNSTVVIPKLMDSYEDIMAAGGMGEDGNYVIADDFTADDMMYFYGTNSTIDLNGKTITADKKGQYLLAAPENSTLHLTGEGTVDMGKGFFATGDNAEIIIDGGTYNATNTGTLNSIKHCSLAQNGGKIVINGGTFTTDVEDTVLFFATSNARIEINGGFFENTVDATPDLLGIGTNKYNTNRIIITGGTFVNYNPLADKMCYTGKWPAAGEAAFGGPWILIPGGYKVVSETQSNGDVWYTVVPK